MIPILTALTGSNADLLPRILELYVPEGSIIADVTAGKLAFWKNIDITKYDLRATDLLTGTDFRHLPYAEASIDALILDPPYMHAGATVHLGLQSRYNNASVPRGHEGIIRLYGGGIIEASRVLKQKGLIVIKCQDETESGKQRFSQVPFASG